MTIYAIMLLVIAFLAGGIVGAAAVGICAGSRIAELGNEVQELQRKLTPTSGKGAKDDR